MSFIIPGKIPNNCDECPMYDQEFSLCNLNNQSNFEHVCNIEIKYRPQWCPIIGEPGKCAEMNNYTNSLFDFLECFEADTLIKILDKCDEIIYEGTVGGVPQRISNMKAVVEESVKNMGDYISINVEVLSD